MENNENKADTMEVDSGVIDTSNDFMIALLAQQQEMGYRKENMNDTAFQELLESNIKEMNKKKEKNKEAVVDSPQLNSNSNDTENDEEIARLMQENYIREQEMLSKLTRNTMAQATKGKSSGGGDVSNYKTLILNELENQYKEKLIKEKFNYEYFKNQLNSTAALPIKKYIKDFYIDFEQKSRSSFKSPDEQSQYLRNFLTELQKRLLENQLWRNTSKEEQENAMMGMEKLVTTKLINITFGPSEDLAKDALLSHKIHMHSWIKPRHLDLPEFEDKIFDKASRELSKMNLYKFYNDKVVCLENCLRLIEDSYKKNISQKDSFSNDLLMPLLVYIILKTNPKNLISNVQYIQRYINPNFLSVGICEFSLTSVKGAVAFIEEMTQASLNITAEEYDENIIEITRNDSNKINNEDIVMRNNSKEASSSSSNGGGIIKSIKDYIFGDSGISPSQNNYPGFMPQANQENVQRNTSLFGNNSVVVSDSKNELRENYLNNVNNPLTRPFESHLTEEEQNNLLLIDQELKASLSINSTIDRSASEKNPGKDI